MTAISNTVSHSPLAERAIALADDKLLLGLEIANDPTAHGMERQGRPLTNREMSAVLWLGFCLRCADAEQGICCGEVEYRNGAGGCSGVAGICPLKMKGGE